MKQLNNEKFPFISEIEFDILPALTLNRAMWVDLSDHIQPTYWHTKDRATIFKIFKLFFEKYRTFPTETQTLDICTRKLYKDEVAEEAKKIYKRINKGMTADEQKYLYDECKIFIKHNKIKTGLLQSVDLMEKEDFMEIETVMKDAVNWDPEVLLGTNIVDVEERFAALQKLSDNIIPSPWKSLNSIMSGGFFGKELTIFAASSSVGKSIALDNCAYHAWELGYNVVIITLELSEVRKAQRIDAAALKIPLPQVQFAKDDVIKFFENKKSKAKLFIKEFPTNSISTQNIYKYLYQLELYHGIKMYGGGKNGLNMLVVDYLDIMNPTGKKAGDAYVDQGTVGADLRAISQTLDVPVVTACLDPDTEVITHNGKCKIIELGIGDYVLSKYGIFNKVLNHKMYLKTKKYKITTEDGKSIICSANHVFPSNKGEISIETGLSVGDELLVKED